MAVRESDLVDLRLDVLPLVLLQVLDVDLVVEMTDVADDGVVLHLLHMRFGDDIDTASRRHEHITDLAGIFHAHDLVTFHCGLQRADRIDLGDDDARGLRLERLAAALAYVAISRHNGNLPGKHDVRRTHDAVHE